MMQFIEKLKSILKERKKKRTTTELLLKHIIKNTAITYEKIDDTRMEIKDMKQLLEKMIELNEYLKLQSETIIKYYSLETTVLEKTLAKSNIKPTDHDSNY